jgi:hypothetical protein
VSNYSQTTFFTPKDSLPAGNPAKVIYGAAYDVEFGNISTAIASKYDSTTTTITLSGSFTAGNVNVTSNTIPANGIYLATTNSLGLSTNSLLRLSINANGAVLIAAPSSGPALTVTALAATTGILVTGTDVAVAQLTAASNASRALLGFSQTGSTTTGRIGCDGSNVMLSDSTAGDLCMTGSNGSSIRWGQEGGATQMVLTSSGSLLLAGATGGAQGAGTLNATGLYINGVAVSTGSTGIPINNQTGAYTLVLSDANKAIMRQSGGAVTWTIPANSSVAFPVGTAVTFENLGTGAVTIGINSDNLIWLNVAGNTGSRTLAVNSSATAHKIATTTWVLTGTGIS